MRVAPIFPLALLCAVAARPAAGQLDSVLATVPHRARLRLQLLDSTIVIGRMLTHEQQRMVLQTVVRTGISEGRFEERSVVVDSIAGAWIHSGTRWKRGSAIGGAIGASAMLLWMRIDLDLQDGSSCNVLCWTAGAGFGAIFGGLWGALVGYQFVVWKPLTF